MIDVKSFIGCCQEKNKKRVITGQDSVILWYHREAEGKNRKLLIHTIQKRHSVEKQDAFYYLEILSFFLYMCYNYLT